MLRDRQELGRRTLSGYRVRYGQPHMCVRQKVCVVWCVCVRVRVCVCVRVYIYAYIHTCMHTSQVHDSMCVWCVWCVCE